MRDQLVSYLILIIMWKT